MEERWKFIQDFWTYEISNFGRCRNSHTGRVLTLGVVTGDTSAYTFRRDGASHTRSACLLVAEAFLPRENWWEADSEVFNSVIQLDYNRRNCRVDNLMWRPRWFVWKYKNQEDTINREHYRLPVENKTTGESYNSILEACMTEGLLFRDVYNDCGMLGQGVAPHGHKFRFLEEQREDD